MKINFSKYVNYSFAIILSIGILSAAGCGKGLTRNVKNSAGAKVEASSQVAGDKPAALNTSFKAGDKENASKPSAAPIPVSLINETGMTVQERFKTPQGFERIAVQKGSFQEYLRNLKLKPHGSKVLYYNGAVKDRTGVYEAVVDKSIGSRDLHQCADAVMLLRGEYLYNQGRYNEIHFNFVNGFRTEYSKWMQGYRITVNGNNASWIKSGGASNSYEEFRRYMDMVFAYASTLSLEKELKPLRKDEMQIGDVFIKGADPGHAIIIVDMAENKNTGEKLFITAQSYMPAQETQILCNPEATEISPWYNLNFAVDLKTPEWTFKDNQLRRFIDNQ